MFITNFFPLIAGNYIFKEPCKPSARALGAQPFSGSSNDIKSVPEDFQNNLLREPVAMTAFSSSYIEICDKLNNEMPFFNDYRILGEKIGLGKDEILSLGQKDNPSGLILEKFNAQKGNSIGKLRKFLEEMGRHDVVTVIDEWIVDRWRVFCSSSSSTHV